MGARDICRGTCIWKFTVYEIHDDNLLVASFVSDYSSGLKTQVIVNVPRSFAHYVKVCQSCLEISRRNEHVYCLDPSKTGRR